MSYSDPPDGETILKFGRDFIPNYGFTFYDCIIEDDTVYVNVNYETTLTKEKLGSLESHMRQTTPRLYFEEPMDACAGGHRMSTKADASNVGHMRQTMLRLYFEEPDGCMHGHRMSTKADAFNVVQGRLFRSEMSCR